MNQRPPPQLDMTVDGEFVSPPKAPIASRLLIWAVLIAVVAGALSLAALALWVALLILPVAIGAGIVAWAMVRYRVWRQQRAVRSQADVWRPL